MNERFCYCGKPVAKGRWKYCSHACSERVNHGNISVDVLVYSDQPEHVPAERDYHKRTSIGKAFKRWGLAS